ncbi:unnamed protein product [Discosporangium mesarthrocarpum]
MLAHLFRLFDRSCDGKIDEEELGRLLRALHIRVSDVRLLSLLQVMDR